MTIFTAIEFRSIPSLLKEGADVVLFERSVEWSKHEFVEETDIYTRKRTVAKLIAQALGKNTRVKASITIPPGHIRMAKKFNRVICFHSNSCEESVRNRIKTACS